MEISNIRPEEPRPPRDAARPNDGPRRDAPASAPSGSDPAAVPTEGGVLAASENSGRQDADQFDARDQTRDRVAQAREGQLSATLAEIAREARVPANARLSIEVEPDSKDVTFYVRHKETGEVLHQVPDEITRKLQEKFADAMTGLLVDRRL